MSASPAPGERPRPLDVARTYRVRLVINFALVVAVALGLVLATLPRLVDGELERQELTNLKNRADSMAALVGQQLNLYQTLNQSAPRPILLPSGDTEELIASDTVKQALGTPTSGFLAEMTTRVALADVTV